MTDHFNFPKGVYTSDRRIAKANIAIWREPAMREQNALVWRYLMLARAWARPTDTWLTQSWQRAEAVAEDRLSRFPLLQHGFLLPYVLAYAFVPLKSVARSGGSYERFYVADGMQEVWSTDSRGNLCVDMAPQALKLRVTHRKNEKARSYTQDAVHGDRSQFVRFEVSREASLRMVKQEHNDCWEIITDERKKTAERPVGCYAAATQARPLQGADL